MKFLIVVDMQVDFISGSLGSDHAAAIVPNVVEKVKNFNGKVIFTRDTHFEDYFETQEGRKLPVLHCVKDTDGWEVCDELKPFVDATRQVAEFYSLPVLDLWANYGIQPRIPVMKNMYVPDGLHPNDAGHGILANKLRSFLEQL